MPQQVSREAEISLQLLSKVLDHPNGAIGVDFPGMSITFRGKLGQDFLKLCKKALAENVIGD